VQRREEKHVQTIRKRGKVYYRHRIAKVSLPADYEHRCRVARQINAGLDRRPNAVTPGTVKALVTSWQQSPGFLKLRPLTKKDYQRTATDIAEFYLPVSKSTFGDQRVEHVTRGVVTAIRDHFAKKGQYRKANKVIAVMCLLLQHAIDLEWIAVNVARDVTKFKTGTPYKAWPPHVLDAVCALTSGRIRQSILGLFLTGLRISDFVNLRWSDIVDGKISVVAGKNRVRVKIAITGDLANLIEELPRDSVMMFTTPKGLPWKDSNLQRAIGYWTEKAGHKGYSAHGLRHARGAELAESGATVNEIMSALGHKTAAMATHYTSTANADTLADSAAEKVDAHRKRTKKVVRMKR